MVILTFSQRKTELLGISVEFSERSVSLLKYQYNDAVRARSANNFNNGKKSPIIISRGHGKHSQCRGQHIESLKIAPECSYL